MTPDIGTVDELCRLATLVRRLGCRVHLAGADAELCELLELAGVADVLLPCPAAETPNPGTCACRGDLR
jgi:hypothetical protein